MFQLRALWALHLKCRVSSTTETYLHLWGTAEYNSSNMMFGSLLYDPDKKKEDFSCMIFGFCVKVIGSWKVQHSWKPFFKYICILLHKLKCIMGVFWSAVKSLMIFFLASLLLFYLIDVLIFFLLSKESTIIFSHFPDIKLSQASQS